MHTLGMIFGWIFFGLLVGFIGRLLVPGRQRMGYVATMFLGIIGSFAGGGISYAFNGGTDPYQPANFIMSVIGAVVVLAVGLWLGKHKEVY